MATYITRIRTEQDDLQIDYEALANLPVANKEAFESMLAKKQDADTAITKTNILTYLEDKSVANAANAANADSLGGKNASEYALAEDYFKWNSDTRNLVLTSGVHYGDELPEAGTVGRIFLKKIEEV